MPDAGMVLLDLHNFEAPEDSVHCLQSEPCIRVGDVWCPLLHFVAGATLWVVSFDVRVWSAATSIVSILFPTSFEHATLV